MGLFGSKKIEDKSAQGAPTSERSVAPPPVAPSSSRQLPAASLPPSAVGIDHAIQLMRTLPTEQNITLVVTVLKTTLESLGIHVSDIVVDAAQRQRDIEARVGQLKGEIVALEKEVDLRVQEITRLEAAHAETTRVKEYLEDHEVEEEIEMPSSEQPI